MLFINNCLFVYFYGGRYIIRVFGIFILNKLRNNFMVVSSFLDLKNGKRRSFNMEGEIYNAFNGMLYDDYKLSNVFCNSEFHSKH